VGKKLQLVMKGPGSRPRRRLGDFCYGSFPYWLGFHASMA
jgi:hypothetical protein